MDIVKKSAYLQGLSEGYALDESKPEGKLLKELLALVSEMADKISVLEHECAELREYIEEVDEDLGVVEDEVYGLEDEEDEEDDGVMYEVTCPSCGETVCFDESVDPESVICPNCNQKFDCLCDLCDENECEGCDKCSESEE